MKFIFLVFFFSTPRMQLILFLAFHLIGILNPYGNLHHNIRNLITDRPANEFNISRLPNISHYSIVLVKSCFNWLC